MVSPMPGSMYTEKCGCSAFSMTIARCPLHGAAPEMLKMLKKAKKCIWDNLAESVIPPGEGCQLVLNGEPGLLLRSIDDIIAKIEGAKRSKGAL